MGGVDGHEGVERGASGVCRGGDSLPDQVERADGLDRNEGYGEKDCRQQTGSVDGDEGSAECAAGEFDGDAAEGDDSGAGPQERRYFKGLPVGRRAHAEAEGENQGGKEERQRDDPHDDADLGE